MNDPDIPDPKPASVLTVARETVAIDKRRVDQGGIRVETPTEEFEERVTADLAESRVEVRRVPIDRVITEIPPPHEEDGVTIIPVVAERPVLTTELVLVEEIHILRTETTRTVEVPVTLRRQRVVETELPPLPAGQDPETPITS